MGNPAQQIAGKVEPRGGIGAIGPHQEHRRTRTLLAGTGALAVEAARAIRSDKRKVLIGTTDFCPQPEMNSTFEDVPYLGHIRDLGNLIVEHCIDEVQVALPVASCFGEFPLIHETARALGIPVSFRLAILNHKPAYVVPKTDGALVVYNDHAANRWPWKFLKRAVDVMVAGSLLLALSPLLLVIALLVKATSAGPVLFRQPRVGFRRREFKMLKFRTMVKNAEQLRKQVAELNSAKGISFKIIKDPRLTPIGGILRRTSLDELPQLFNVLFGEMSLVGPRPIPLWVADQMENSTYYRRFHVAPGLTGWWQVEGREQDFEKMAEQDLYYVDHWSPTLDLTILLRTLPAVWRGQGAH